MLKFITEKQKAVIEAYHFDIYDLSIIYSVKSRYIPINLINLNNMELTTKAVGGSNIRKKF